MRSGTRTQCKSRWTRKAHRPLCRMKLGYELCYLYAALCPATGHLVALILPDMTKASFCLFCSYFSQQVKQQWRNQPVLLIVDRAGAHQSKEGLENGIVLQHLPTACPELNPVERLFEELRKQMSNTIYDTIDDVEKHIAVILKPFFTDTNKIINLSHYDYIRTP